MRESWLIALCQRCCCHRISFQGDTRKLLSESILSSWDGDRLTAVSPVSFFLCTFKQLRSLHWAEGTVGSFPGPGRDGAKETGPSGWFRSWLSVPCEKAREVWGSPASWCFCPTWIFYLVTSISRLCRFVTKGLPSPTLHASGSFSTINHSKKKVYSSGSVFNQFWLRVAPLSW